MYTNFENINYMHNKELVEGVNISSYFYYLAAQPIIEKEGPMLIFPQQDSNLISIESTKNKLLMLIKNEIVHSITIVLIIIATIIIIVIILLICTCYCYFNRPKINIKYQEMKCYYKNWKNKKSAHNGQEEEVQPMQHELSEIESIPHSSLNQTEIHNKNDPNEFKIQQYDRNNDALAPNTSIGRKKWP